MTPDAVREAAEALPLWLVWSNEHVAWWGPNGAGYFVDINSAGRYSYAEAVKHCGGRDASWPPSVGPRGEWPEKNPPELVVPAPEFWDALRSALAAPSSPPKADGSLSRDAMIVEAVRLRSGDTEAEALRALLAMFPPAAPSSPPVEAVVWGVRDDQGEWWFSDPFTEEEARAEAWRLTGSLTRKHEAVPLYTTPPPSPAPAPSPVNLCERPEDTLRRYAKTLLALRDFYPPSSERADLSAHEIVNNALDALLREAT